MARYHAITRGWPDNIPIRVQYREARQELSQELRARRSRYSVLREAYLAEHPICEVCNSAPSVFIHHKISRKTHLCDVSVFQAVCSRACEDMSVRRAAMELVTIPESDFRQVCAALSLASRNLASIMATDREALLEAGVLTLGAMSTSQFQVDEALGLLVKQAQVCGIELTDEPKILPP